MSRSNLDFNSGKRGSWGSHTDTSNPDKGHQFVANCDNHAEYRDHAI